MIQFFTEHLSLIIWIIVIAVFAALFMMTDKVELSKDILDNTGKTTDQLKAREELKYRSEADNQAEIEYIRKYYEKRNETIF